MADRRVRARAGSAPALAIELVRLRQLKTGRGWHRQFDGGSGTAAAGAAAASPPPSRTLSRRQGHSICITHAGSPVGLRGGGIAARILACSCAQVRAPAAETAKAARRQPYRSLSNHPALDVGALPAAPSQLFLIRRARARAGWPSGAGGVACCVTAAPVGPLGCCMRQLISARICIRETAEGIQTLGLTIANLKHARVGLALRGDNVTSKS